MGNLDLMLTITHTDAQTTAALRVELPNRHVELADEVPLTLDATALRALSLIPEAYGAALTAMTFPSRLREAWQRALGYAEGQDVALRLRLHLRGDDRIHAIRWELLQDPVTHTPIAYRERVTFSRFLSSDHLGETPFLVTPSQLRAVVAVSDTAGHGMAPVDVAGEVARAEASLGGIAVTLLDGRNGRPRATLANLVDTLRDWPQVLALTCHGRLVDGVPYLYLAGDSLPTPGMELVRQVADLRQRPLLVILASCQGAGHSYETLSAIGPQLARAGIGAVIAMQGDVPLELIATLMPRLFTELRRDGQIDRALAAARAALPTTLPWWQPVLWMAVKDGALWHEVLDPPFIDNPGLYPPCPCRVGQQHVSDDLQTRLDNAIMRRTASVVLLESPPGYGKRALVRAVTEACIERGGIVLAVDFSFPPVGDDPEQLAQVAVPETLREQIELVWPTGATAGLHWIDLMAQVQVVSQQTLVPSRLGITDDPEACISVIRSIAYKLPVLLVLEHWERTNSVWDTLLETLATVIEGTPVRLFVVVTRDRLADQADQAPTALNQAIARGTIPCHRLTRIRADDLGTALGRINLKLCDRLQTLSGGHPALAMMLWDEWVGTGMVEIDDHGVWQPTSQAAASPWVAGTMHDLALRLLRTRIGHDSPLPVETVRHALAVAALEGPCFTAQAVADATGVALAPLLEVCDLLVDDVGDDGEILVEEGPVPQPEDRIHVRLDRYRFALPYLHLVFARMIQGSARQQAALRLATVLEHRYQPEPARVAGALATLFTLGGASTRAESYRLQHERDQAEQSTEQALRWVLDSLIRQGLRDTERMYEAYMDLGDWLEDRLRYSEGIDSYREALRIADLLVDQVRIARACTCLGGLLEAQGELTGSRPYLERALAIREQVLGPVHPDTASSLNNLGGLLRAQGELAGAKLYLERALTIQEQVLGPDHPDTQLIRQNLIVIQQHLRDENLPVDDADS